MSDAAYGQIELPNFWQRAAAFTQYQNTVTNEAIWVFNNLSVQVPRLPGIHLHYNQYHRWEHAGCQMIMCALGVSSRGEGAENLGTNKILQLHITSKEKPNKRKLYLHCSANIKKNVLGVYSSRRKTIKQSGFDKAGQKLLTLCNCRGIKRSQWNHVSVENSLYNVDKTLHHILSVSRLYYTHISDCADNILDMRTEL